MLEQAFIAFSGLISAWITQQNNEELKRYVCIIGIASQPFWFYSTYKAEQWGMFFMCFFYSCVWVMGIKNNFFTNGTLTNG